MEPIRTALNTLNARNVESIYPCFRACSIKQLICEPEILEPIPNPRDHNRYFYFLFENGHREKFHLPTGMSGAGPALLMQELLDVVITMNNLLREHIAGELYLYREEQTSEAIGQYNGRLHYYSHVCEFLDAHQDLLRENGVWHFFAEKYNYPEWLVDIWMGGAK